MTRFGRNILEAALVGLEAQAAKINQQIAEIRSQLKTGDRGLKVVPRRRRRAMNPEARQRIAEAQRKRWAAYRAEQQGQGSRKSIQANAKNRRKAA